MSTYSILMVRVTFYHKTAAQIRSSKSVQSQTSKDGFHFGEIQEACSKLHTEELKKYYIRKNKVPKELRKLYERETKWETLSYHIYR